MATYYVSSVDGNDADDGSTWALAKATVTGALAVATGAGPHTIYVDSAHAAVPAAAIAWDVATAGGVVAIISVDRNGSVTTGHNGWLAGGRETVSANVNAFTIGSAARAYTLFIYGMSIVGNSGSSGTNTLGLANANTPNAVNLWLVSCNLSTPGTSTLARINIGRASGSGSAYSAVRLDHCTFTLINSANSIGAIVLQAGSIEITNPTIAYAGATKPTVLFGFSVSCSVNTTIQDGDLSDFNTSAGNYVAVTNFTQGRLNVINCKLSATPGLVAGTWPSNFASITIVNTDSSDTHNVFEYRNRLGTITENATNYANNGGQFDGSGIAWEIVTTSACSEYEPFAAPWLNRWVTTTGSQDLHLQLLRDSATDYTNREVWGEFEVLESASFPNGTLSSTRNSRPFDGTGVDLTNSSDAWTESLTNDNEMECRVTRTVAEKSLVRGRLSVGVASTTLYLDPALRIGAQAANPAVRWNAEGAFAAEPGGGTGNVPRFGSHSDGPSFRGVSV